MRALALAFAFAGSLAIPLVGGCGGDVSGAVAEDELIAGDNSLEHPEVGLLLLNAWSLCTATLVSPRVVITAGHCYDGKSGRREEDTHTFFVHTKDGEIHRFDADEFRSFGTYRAFFSSADLALVHLKEPVPAEIARPAVLSRTPPRGRVTVYGYGCTDRVHVDQGMGEKRAASFEWGTWQTHLCPGDSGGPVLDPSGAIVATTSGGARNNLIVLPDLMADPVGHRADLIAQIAAWESSEGMTCGDWAEAHAFGHAACEWGGNGACGGAGVTTADCAVCCDR